VATTRSCRNGGAERGAPVHDAVSGQSLEPLAGAGLAPPLPGRHAVGEELDAFLRDTRAHAVALGEAAAGAPEEAFLAAVSFAADVISGLALEHPPTRAEVDRLVTATAEAAGADERVVRVAICSRALRDPQLLELPPALAAEAVLRILFALATIESVSLWVPTPRGRVRRAVALGDQAGAGRFRAAARRVLAVASGAETGEAGLVAFPVRRWQRPAAALVVRVQEDSPSPARALAREAAAVLGNVVDREALLERGTARERSLVESGERRLARLAFDLHDGAIQHVIALAGDVQLLRTQLGELVPSSDRRTIAEGRVDDLQARLVSVEAELRELTRSLEPSTIARTPLEDTLAEQLAAFGRQNDIRTTLEAHGDFGAMTPSQRIALARIVQESLANARDHGGATDVRITVTMRHDGVHATITDDGKGFDVERTFVQAARKGRLGLVGMSERVRLLGGHFDIESRPGGPTTVSAAFPPWKPVTAAADRFEEALPAGGVSVGEATVAPLFAARG
jgi:signal transduction histidine kinase